MKHNIPMFEECGKEVLRQFKVSNDGTGKTEVSQQ